MKCPTCSHEMIPGKGRCLYCGFVLMASPSAGEPSVCEWDPVSGALKRLVDSPLHKEALKTGNKPQFWDKGFPDNSHDSISDLILEFGLVPSERKAPMSRMTLLLIFLASGLLAFFVLWLVAR